MKCWLLGGHGSPGFNINTVDASKARSASNDAVQPRTGTRGTESEGRATLKAVPVSYVMALAPKY